jgi:hypothetical protein
MSKAIIVKADNLIEDPIQIVDFNEDESFSTIKKVIKNRFDCISLPSLGVDMWIDDEGKLLDLEINPFATALWINEYGMNDIVVGDVIITGGPDSSGHTKGMDDKKIVKVMLTVKEVMDKIIDK